MGAATLISGQSNPELWAASEALERTILDRGYDKQLTYLDQGATLNPAWVLAAARSDAILHFTIERSRNSATSSKRSPRAGIPRTTATAKTPPK